MTKQETSINGNGQATRERGKGPVKYAYENHDQKELSHRAENPSKLYITDNETEESYVVQIAHLSPAVLYTLAAQAFARQIETYVRNHVDAAKQRGESALSLAEKRASELEAGHFYVRTSGFGGKREVDVTPWVEAFELMGKQTKQPVNEGKLAVFKMKLEAMSGKERNVYIGELKRKFPAYRAALLEISAQRAKQEMKSKPKEEINYDMFA